MNNEDGAIDGVATPSNETFDQARARRLRRLERLANALDSRFRIPGLGLRVGWDPLIGLLPGIGDFVTLVPGIYMIAEARRMGVSRVVLMRMGLNIGIDATVGSVPLFGDLFDVFFKSHRRNMDLVRKSLAKDSLNPPSGQSFAGSRAAVNRAT